MRRMKISKRHDEEKEKEQGGKGEGTRRRGGSGCSQPISIQRITQPQSSKKTKRLIVRKLGQKVGGEEEVEVARPEI